MSEKRSSIDDIIELYMKDVDVSLIEQNLKLTVEERIVKLQNHVNFILELRRAKERSDRTGGIGDND